MPARVTKARCSSTTSLFLTLALAMLRHGVTAAVDLSTADSVDSVERSVDIHLEARCGLENPKHYWDESASACVELKDKDLNCLDDHSCHAFLGPLSVCNPESWKCECFDTENDGRRPTGLFGRTCILKKYVGDFCETDLECRIWNHPKTICSHVHPLLPHEKLCMCPPSVSCNLIGSSCSKDEECSNSLGQFAKCKFHVGENICLCETGKVCHPSLGKKNGGLSVGGVIGIAVGCSVCVIAILVSLVWLLRRRGRKHRQFV